MFFITSTAKDQICGKVLVQGSGSPSVSFLCVENVFKSSPQHCTSNIREHLLSLHINLHFKKFITWAAISMITKVAFNLELETAVFI